MSMLDKILVIGSCSHGNNFTNCVQCAREKDVEMSISGSPRPVMQTIEGTPYADINEFLNECLETMRSKGHDYREGNDADLLHNFRTVGEDAGLPMEKIWYVYTSKHWKAIKTYIKSGGQSESEPIESRIKDIIVYMLLFYRMTREIKDKNATV